jgi:hypothetical protein
MKEFQIGTREIKATWTKEMIDDLKSYHGLDNSFEEQLISVLRSETRKRSIIKIWKSKN